MSGERDRLELWRLDNFLAVNGTTSAHSDRRLRLYRLINPERPAGDRARMLRTLDDHDTAMYGGAQ